jgi:hypothetical protein
MNADQAIRRLTAGAVLVVAAIAAVVSFVHIEHLAVMNGQTSVAAMLLPLSIDDTVAAASLVMLRAARAGLGTPRRAGVAQERASVPRAAGQAHRSSGIAVLKGTGIERADAGIPGTGRPGARPGTCQLGLPGAGDTGVVSGRRCPYHPAPGMGADDRVAPDPGGRPKAAG